MTVFSTLRNAALCVFAMAWLSGCVTVTESRFSAKASPDKAVENYTQLGVGYLQRGRPDWARQRLTKALEIDPNNAPANDAMGLVWQSEGEDDLAEEYFRKALANDSEFTQARHHLGRLFMQQGRFDDAGNYLQRAVDDRYYDNRVSAFNDLALNTFRGGDRAGAIDVYMRALRLAPYNVNALVNVSTLLFEEQRFEESQRYFDRFDRLVQRDQTDHTAHSLWLGVKLATISQQTQRAATFASDLKARFAQSQEYRLYQESLQGAGS
ncbi:type IV pilus biogenesis/stability protein PilW [Bacterioplanes sanyensis]|uniref:Type IV pilus biogenesis/stability protein PilW n=1 Tax=Bacterioplanes sanyensis TaxID=1249553 RepID=A0A222FJK1_9GAMM|nr:type IV pilus biogenesis/stability protein PilW [Bacterioplanes sanyensis]ASP39225.1 type IV pilus biogenesis/stability protein PilW [Bacterioplanes sanyensis]